MKRYLDPLLSVLRNLLLLMVIYTLCRLVFFAENRSLFPEVDGALLGRLLRGGWRFDISALMYTNALYILLALLPLKIRASKGWQTLVKTLFVVPNFLIFAADLADAVYFPYSNRRTTFTIFRQFGGDDLGGVFLHEVVAHWYLVLLGVAILFALIKLYRKPTYYEGRWNWKDYAIHLAVLWAVIYPIVGGMRGGFGVTVRPIALNDANLYADRPLQAGVVLNTAFSFYRTLGDDSFKDPHYFEEESEAQAIFNPVHQPADSAVFRPKNVVVLLLESFSASYSGYLTELQGFPQPTHMPFLDSLMQESLVFRNSFANGRVSIEALPSVMCGIPSLIEPFFLTPYAQNDVSGLARELGEKGYSSAFFHGAKRQSLGLAGFANNIGFQTQFSRESYDNEADYDGTWGIWDEPFLQYFEQGINQLRPPFMATVFTLSSHHPFNVPAQYENAFDPGTIPMHRCVAYSDLAIRRFFEAARKEPWYEDTIFIITGDHTNRTDLPEYQTDRGRFLIPIIFYTPDGSLKGLRDGIAQQTDIKPTVLGWLGYDKPFLSFGVNLIETADEDTFAVNYLPNGTFQYFEDGWLLQFDGQKSTALYRFQTDLLLDDNRLDAEPEVAASLELKLKAILQQYISRMITNRMM